MAHDTIHGKNLYLRVTEPLYFVNTLVKNAERSRSIGFNVKVMMGGPEKFPTHTFEGAGIKKNKLLLFTDATIRAAPQSHDPSMPDGGDAPRECGR